LRYSRPVCDGAKALSSEANNKALKMKTTTWVTTFDGASSRVFTLSGVPGRLEEIVSERRDGPHKPDFDEWAKQSRNRRTRSSQAKLALRNGY
jgi:hypothetical protein